MSDFRFLKTMTDFDPIRTVYDHLSGRQPVALMVGPLSLAFFLLTKDFYFKAAYTELDLWIEGALSPTTGIAIRRGHHSFTYFCSSFWLCFNFLSVATINLHQSLTNACYHK